MQSATSSTSSIRRTAAGSAASRLTIPSKVVPSDFATAGTHVGRDCAAQKSGQQDRSQQRGSRHCRIAPRYGLQNLTSEVIDSHPYATHNAKHPFTVT